MLTVEAAQHLTTAIKIAAESLHLLLHRAWSLEAWRVLGYADWRSYIQALGISRSRSYQLLDQHKVTLAISEAAGVPVDGVVTEAIARDLKPRLAQIAEDVRDAVTEAHQYTAMGADPAAVLRVVTTTLDAARHPQSTRLNVLPSMADLRAAGDKRRGSGSIWYTPRTAVIPLLPSLPPAPAHIWCPADSEGSSNIVDVLREYGYRVTCTDISDGQDFFAYDRATLPREVDVVVTNPPYGSKRAWLEKTLALGIDRFAYLLPELGLGDWASPTLSTVGDRVGFVMLSKRIAYSEIFGEAPRSNAPFSSLWLTVGLTEPGDQQILWREVPARA